MAAYLLAIQTALSHGLSAALRRRRTHVAFALVILPALIPLLILMVPHEHGDDLPTRDMVMELMIKTFYVTGVTPLLALFFAAMLVGEDVESQTVSYVLTRPIPRTAWILGKFLAYLVVGAALIAISIVTLRLTVIPYDLPETAKITTLTLLRYEGVAIMSLLGYGALCTLLGALLRHPVIIGALLFFGWQRIAMLAPGITDLLTIEKYVTALLPPSGNVLEQLFNEAKDEIFVSKVTVEPGIALLVLLLFSGVCLALAGFTVRHREYTVPAAVTD